MPDHTMLALFDTLGQTYLVYHDSLEVLSTETIMAVPAAQT